MGRVEVLEPGKLSLYVVFVANSLAYWVPSKANYHQFGVDNESCHSLQTSQAVSPGVQHSQVSERTETVQRRKSVVREVGLLQCSAVADMDYVRDGVVGNVQ